MILFFCAPKKWSQTRDAHCTTFLDAENLQKLRLHLLSLGGLTENADFEDSDEDDDDDNI